MDFQKLVATHAEATAAKQARLASELGSHEWSYNEVEGVLRFDKSNGSCVSYPAQLLGFESSAGRFRWSWTDPKAHPSSTHVARLLQKFGDQQKLAVLTEAECSLADHGATGDDLAALASALADALFYYRAPRDGGALYLLVLPDEDGAEAE